MERTMATMTINTCIFFFNTQWFLGFCRCGGALRDLYSSNCVQAYQKMFFLVESKFINIHFWYVDIFILHVQSLQPLGVSQIQDICFAIHWNWCSRLWRMLSSRTAKPHTTFWSYPKPCTCFWKGFSVSRCHIQIFAAGTQRRIHKTCIPFEVQIQNSTRPS